MPHGHEGVEVHVPRQLGQGADHRLLALQRPPVRRVGAARAAAPAGLRDHRQLLGRGVPLLRL